MNKPECKTLPDGSQEWYLNGMFHREDGGPALVKPNGTKVWCLYGKFHREDGPASEFFNGIKSWFLNGEEAHPETIVDLWLERGVFCWYDETTDTLNFGESNEQA